MRMPIVPNLALAGLVLAAACSDSSAPGASAAVAFRVATPSSGTVSTAAAGLSALSAGTPVTYTDGAGNSLIIASAQVVLKQVSFERADNATACVEGEHDAEHASDPADGTHHSSGALAAFDEGDQDQADSHDACDARALGPILVDLPLGGPAAQQFTVTVEPGTYTGVRFHLHKANAGSESAFLTANPDFAGISIRVIGTYNTVPFTFVTDLNAMQEQQFTTPITVDASGIADVTLLVDLSKWFLDAGARLIDPATALHGGANEHLVWNNIKASFRSFRDADHDGHEDH